MTVHGAVGLLLVGVTLFFGGVSGLVSAAMCLKCDDRLARRALGVLFAGVVVIVGGAVGFALA